MISLYYHLQYRGNAVSIGRLSGRLLTIWTNLLLRAEFGLLETTCRNQIWGENQ